MHFFFLGALRVKFYDLLARAGASITVNNIEFHGSLIRSASFYQDSPGKAGETGRKRSHTTGELSSMTEGKSTEEVIGRGRSRSLTEPTKGDIA